MDTWKITSENLKRYPHFDSQLSIAAATKLATDPTAVASHKFYPFLLYSDRWTRFAPRGKQGKEKLRPIRYSARGDAYIFSYYRHVLSKAYEAALAENALSDSILAYRRILDQDGKGKCNIHFARDAFEAINKLENCCVVALDISSFFESLDHHRLKTAWCKLLGVKKLPEDHFRVYRAITRYAVVEKRAVYERLGYFGPKAPSKSGRPSSGYLVSYKNMPKQLCSGSEFRQKIAGGDGSKSIIDVNLKTYGIPQGSPISDLLANIYLLEFDCAVRERIAKLGGVYLRYSDDILLICPGGDDVGESLASDMRATVKKFGEKLVIKERKSSVFVFNSTGGTQTCTLVQGEQGKNGLEYLGFRFDGRKVFIRDSTLSNLYRKVTRNARSAAVSLVKRYPGKDASFLRGQLDCEQLIERFGRVQDFAEVADDYRKWTFWTYARRAVKIFGPKGLPISRQLRDFRSKVKDRAERELERALEKAGIT